MSWKVKRLSRLYPHALRASNPDTDKLTQSLKERLAQREAILEAVSFAIVELQDADAWRNVVDRFLCYLGEASGADRVYIFQCDDIIDPQGEVIMRLQTEWNARDLGNPHAGIPDIATLAVREAGYDRWLAMLMAGQMIAGHAKDFAPQERRLLNIQGIKSILLMPVLHRSGLWGMIGFDHCQEEHLWSSSEREILRLATRALGAALEREDVKAELEARVAERAQDLIRINHALSQEVEFHRIAEEARQVAQVQLEQARKMESIGQLAAGIAHEINTPTQFVGDNLRFLQDSSQTLQQLLTLYREVSIHLPKDKQALLQDKESQWDISYLEEEIPKAILQSIDGTQRVSKIVRALKEFSHPSDMAHGQVDINHCLETTATVARGEWKYVANVAMDLDPRLPLVPGITAELNQVFLNLLVNAAHAIGQLPRAAGQLGQITVRTRLLSDQVEIQLEDTGIGIPEDIESRVFDPFFTTKPMGQGTGQGLTVCYQIIVQRHKGTIRFVSQAGKGTTFFVTLPLQGDALSPV